MMYVAFIQVLWLFRSARPLIEPLMPVPSRPTVRPVPSVRKKNPDHLYSLINHRRTTVNLSKEKKRKKEKKKKEKEKKRKRAKSRP